MSLDADALLGLRKLSVGSQSLLELIAASCRHRADPIILTEFIARHELSSIASEISSYERTGAIRVEGLEARNPMYRELIRSGVHKGEAEAIAWIHSKPVDGRPVFVSRDTVAIRIARRHHLAATDVFGLIVEAVISNVISAGQARDALETCGMIPAKSYAGLRIIRTLTRVSHNESIARRTIIERGFLPPRHFALSR